jgi:hypothetical protein
VVRNLNGVTANEESSSLAWLMAVPADASAGL